MPILDDQQVEKLLENGEIMLEGDRSDSKYKLIPHAKINLPNTPPSTWLLAALMPDDPDEAFGLMHIGGGTPELGFVRISELESLTGYQGKGVYHDPMFKYAAPRDILEYANDARRLKQIVLQFDETIDVDDFYS